VKNDSSELIYVLLFVAIVLFQYLLPWLRRRRGGEQDEEPIETEPRPQDVEPEMQPPDPTPPSAAHATLLPPHLATYKEGRNNAAGRGRPLDRPLKRYSRRALFGSKSRIQDAMVAAVILGPCRASSPHDDGK